MELLGKVNLASLALLVLGFNPSTNATWSTLSEVIRGDRECGAGAPDALLVLLSQFLRNNKAVIVVGSVFIALVLSDGGETLLQQDLGDVFFVIIQKHGDIENLLNGTLLARDGAGVVNDEMDLLAKQAIAEQFSGLPSASLIGQATLSKSRSTDRGQGGTKFFAGALRDESNAVSTQDGCDGSHQFSGTRFGFGTFFEG